MEKGGRDLELERTRYSRRKKRKINRLLNIAIIVVLFLIAIFVYQLFFKSSDEEVVKEEEIEEIIEEEEIMDEEELEQSDERENENLLEEDRDNDLETDIEEQSREAEWEPIGTIQEEPFHAVFEKDHVNWQEMTKALQVATGLGDEMIIWWLGNGGDHLSAVGYVSTSETEETPFKVRLEWVTNRGWKPVSVEQVLENPYLQR